MSLLVIQRGHYARTRGATGTAGRDSDPTEQEFAVRAAAEVARHAQDAGWQTRIINADEPLSRYKGDAFVAIHCDGSTAESARGASVGYQTSEGSRFASMWKRAYSAAGWKGFRPDNNTEGLARYYGVHKAVSVGNRRAMIIESGFLTNELDEAVLQTRGPSMVAQSVVAALLGNPNVVPVRPSVPPVLGSGATLRMGSTGDAVRQWQSILAGAGLYPQAEIDGHFGRLTETATRQFQTQIGVVPDGVVGPATRTATARVLAWLAAISDTVRTSPDFPGTVRFGDVGWTVKVWQRELQKHGYRVGGGRFDHATSRAVTHWQDNHHPPLDVDGVAGPATWHSVVRS